MRRQGDITGSVWASVDIGVTLAVMLTMNLPWTDTGRERIHLGFRHAPLAYASPSTGDNGNPSPPRPGASVRDDAPVEAPYFRHDRFQVWQASESVASAHPTVNWA